MKSLTKNLIISVITVLLAALFCVGVSFAYFSSDYKGGDNTITSGNFIFSAQTSITQSNDIVLKAPTIINIPQIMPDSPLFNSDGDDEYFNSMITAITINAQNKSDTDMAFYASITSAASGNNNYTAFGAVQYFVFDSNYTAVLAGTKVSATVAKGDYAAAIREISALPTSPLSPPIYPPSDSDNDMATFFNTHKALSVGRGNSKLLMQHIKSEKPLTVDGTLVPTQANLLAIVWLDWRGYKKALDINRLEGLITITVTVTAEQYMFS